MSRIWITDDDLDRRARFNFPSWITEPMSIPGQLSMLDPDPDDTPPHGIPRPAPLAPPVPLPRLDWATEVELHTSEELLEIVRSHPVETDEDSDRVMLAIVVLADRGIRFLA